VVVAPIADRELENLPVTGQIDEEAEHRIEPLLATDATAQKPERLLH
jgi:hypothetical protein